MYNSTKEYIKQEILKLIEQCNDTEHKQGEVNIDDIKDCVNELKCDLWNQLYPHESKPRRYKGAVDEYEGCLSKWITESIPEEKFNQMLKEILDENREGLLRL